MSGWLIKKDMMGYLIESTAQKRSIEQDGLKSLLEKTCFYRLTADCTYVSSESEFEMIQKDIFIIQLLLFLSKSGRQLNVI